MDDDLKVEVEYAEDGSVVAKTCHWIDGTVNRVDYDVNGTRSQEVTYNASGSITSRQKFDSKGRLIYCSAHLGDGTELSHSERIYDINGDGFIQIDFNDCQTPYIKRKGVVLPDGRAHYIASTDLLGADERREMRIRLYRMFKDHYGLSMKMPDDVQLTKGFASDLPSGN